MTKPRLTCRCPDCFGFLKPMHYHACEAIRMLSHRLGVKNRFSLCPIHRREPFTSCARE